MFKKGDKVICIDSIGTGTLLVEGKCYEVLEVSRRFIYVGETDYGFFPERFVLATPLLAELF